jgi:hypothetical protein
MTLAQRIEKLESIESQSGRKLHESANLSYVTVNDLKNDGVKMPRYDTISKILVAFPRLNARWLILDEEPMFLPYLGTELSGYAVHEPAVEYMKRSTLYNFPLLVEEVEELRKILAELRKSVAEMQAELKTLRDNSKDDK